MLSRSTSTVKIAGKDECTDVRMEPGGPETATAGKSTAVVEASTNVWRSGRASECESMQSSRNNGGLRRLKFRSQGDCAQSWRHMSCRQANIAVSNYEVTMLFIVSLADDVPVLRWRNNTLSLPNGFTYARYSRISSLSGFIHDRLNHNRVQAGSAYNCIDVSCTRQ